MNAVFEPYLNLIEKEILSALPQEPGPQWRMECFGPLDKAVVPGHLSPLIAPTRELVLAGGKRWRPLLLVLCAEAFMQEQGISGERQKELMESAYHLTPLVELVHTASLIHDDIEDRATTRRNFPAAYISHGLDTALNAGSWLYFAAPMCIESLCATQEMKNALLMAYTLETRRLHLGQAMDIAWHRNAEIFPDVQEYLAMVKSKTGTLSSLAARTGLLIAGADADKAQRAAECARGIGAGFQIIDDVTNITSGNKGKDRGDDIVEGKKSLPVLLYAGRCGAGPLKELQEYFKAASSEGIGSPAVESAIKILNESGAVEEAKEYGLKMTGSCCRELNDILGDTEACGKINTLFKEMFPAEVIK